MRGRSTGGCAGSGGSADAGGSSGRGDAGSGRDNAGGSDSRGAAGGSSSSSSRLRRTLSARRPVLWLAALYLVFGALPLLALAQFCLASSDDALRHQVQTGLATTAATGAVVTGDRLGALGDLVTAAANDPALAAYLTDHEELGEGESPTEELQQLRNAQPGIAEVVMTDMQGRVLEASHADRALRDPARADWFLAVRGDPRTHLSAGYPADPAAADREVVIAAPVRDRAGRPAAVLAAAYRLAPLQAFVQQIAAAQDIDLLITDRTGTPVAASESGSGSGGERFTAARTVAGSGWTVTAEVPRARALASLNGLHSAVKGTTAALGAVLLVGLAAQVRLAWTRSLAEERLQAARDQAVLLSERKSTLLAEASHEVRTPMNGILGMTELLQATELDPAQRRHAAAIRRSATALLTIVDDLLDLSRIEAGHIVLQPTAFDPRGLCDDVVALLAPRAEEKGLWLLARVDAGVPALLVADAGRIRQVLVNLVGNAVAYTRTGGVDLLVVVDGAGDRVPEGRVAVRFDVRDTGPGLTAEQRTQAFDRFARFASGDADTENGGEAVVLGEARGSGSGGSAERRRSGERDRSGERGQDRDRGGSGLGLAISRELVGALGGEISVDSTLHAGSRFWFTLWLPVAWTTVSARAEDIAAGAVLVADDDEVSRLVARAGLEAAGFSVDVVGDGAQAVEAARRRRYDVVLLDVRMPVLDGPEAARAILADGAPVPVVAVTGEPDPTVHARCLAAGMRAVVAKPVDWLALGKVLRGCRVDVLGAAVGEGGDVEATRGTDGVPEAIADDWDLDVRSDLVDSGVLPEAAAAFAATAPALAHEIAAAADRADSTAVAAAAHRLAGAAAVIGARALAEACRRIERLARRGEVPGPQGAADLATVTESAVRGAAQPGTSSFHSQDSS